jgi:GDP-D-mannose 3',5'-epimerase
MNKDDLIVITGAGGFIAGALTRYFKNKGFTRIRAVDIKPVNQWYQTVEGVESVPDCDLKIKENCYKVCAGAVEVYQLAADMGGMGFIEHNKALCMLSVLINTHMLMAARDVGKVERFFYSSSACAYNTQLQK